VKMSFHCCPKELQKTTKPQGATFYLFIPFIGSISATICVIYGKSHDPQMTQIYADGKKGRIFGPGDPELKSACQSGPKYD